MSKRMNWNKAKRPKAIEEKYEAGTVLRNGRTVAARPMDTLARRAHLAEQNWLVEQEAKKQQEEERQKRRRAAIKAIVEARRLHGFDR